MNDDRDFMLTVNGTTVEIRGAAPGASLLSVLREHLGLTGAKGACEEGECGSCSVLVDDSLVCSCLVLAASAVQANVTTIEGLTQSRDVQAAFVECGAVQCGFCTPGLIVAATDFLAQTSDPDPDDIREALAGNLCRCTGYGRIIEAVVSVARERRGAAT